MIDTAALALQRVPPPGDRGQSHHDRGPGTVGRDRRPGPAGAAGVTVARRGHGHGDPAAESAGVAGPGYGSSSLGRGCDGHRPTRSQGQAPTARVARAAARPGPGPGPGRHGQGSLSAAGRSRAPPGRGPTRVHTMIRATRTSVGLKWRRASLSSLARPPAGLTGCH
jgi:hypothetical protein